PERDCELLRAGYEVRVRVPVEGLVRSTRDDRLMPKEGLRPSEDERDRQRVIHHQTVHVDATPLVPCSATDKHLCDVCALGRSGAVERLDPERPPVIAMQ